MNVENVLGNSVALALADESWQDFGFARRPKHGTFFKKFRPDWKTSLEDRIVHTIICSVVAAHHSAGLFSSDALPQLVLKLTENSDVVRSFGFATRDDAARLFEKLSLDFMEVGIGNWYSIVVNSLQPEAIPDLVVRDQIVRAALTWTKSLFRLKLLLPTIAADNA